MATGKGGSHSSNTQESQTNPWKESHKRREQSWCHHSPPQCDETSLEKRGKQILLHGNFKSSISDVSASFRTHLRSDPTLDSSGQKSLILQRQLRSYKTLDPPKKYQKSIPEKLVLHIYKRTGTHLNISIGQLIAGAFFFSMRSCEYYTTPKGEERFTCILQKGDIRLHRKRRELSHDSGMLHIPDKASPTFRTQKNRLKNATVTQWRTTTTLCLVRIWAEIFIQLDSYSGTTRDTPVNTVWLECQKMTITSQMTTN